MKKLIFILLVVTVTLPFINALLFSPNFVIRAELSHGDFKDIIVINGNNMTFTTHHRLNTGSASVTRGIYGVLNDTIYFITFGRRYTLLTKNGIDTEKKVMHSDFIQDSDFLAVAKLKHVEDDYYITRYYFPMSSDNDYHYKGLHVTFKQ